MLGALLWLANIGLAVRARSRAGRELLHLGWIRWWMHVGPESIGFMCVMVILVRSWPGSIGMIAPLLVILLLDSTSQILRSGSIRENGLVVEFGRLIPWDSICAYEFLPAKTPPVQFGGKLKLLAFGILGSLELRAMEGLAVQIRGEDMKHFCRVRPGVHETAENLLRTKCTHAGPASSPTSETVCS
jgi:hypothetical protein